MSMFGDYKSYKKFQPAYADWKFNRDMQEAKRIEYLRRNPDKINNDDIQRGKTLIRAIDIMDEYSQKRAENMEVATQSIMAMGLEFAISGGAILGFLLSRLKPVQSMMSHFVKGKNAKLLTGVIPAAVGALVGTIAIFPLNAWAAKAEVSASRKGRFEAMRKELKNPKAFVTLTEEQKLEAYRLAQRETVEKDKKISIKSIKALRDMALDSKEYRHQRRLFEMQLAEDEKHLNDELTPNEVEDAKKDQQLLTSLVEKIDIASQDYAENAELTADTLTACILGCGTLINLGITKLLNACKVKSARKISLVTQTATILLTLGASIFSAQVSKQASRVGRFKIKQQLMQNPAQLVYVDDKNTAAIKDIKPIQDNKQGIIEFLKTAWKNNKEFEEYKKKEGAAEKRFYKALEKMEFTPGQMKDAKRLQKNTFKTFNKVDENSQKYSESVEALGQSVAYPINLIFTGIGLAIGVPFLMKNTKNSLEAAQNMVKYMSVILLSSLPSILINAGITKEQKKASRVADMMAINEIRDYRQFRA